MTKFHVIVSTFTTIKKHPVLIYLSEFQDLMDASSQVLHSAFTPRLHFASVTVVVPAAWSASACGLRLDPPASAYAPADIEIDKPGPLTGFQPTTRQSGGCGTPGDLITVPHTFITNSNITALKARQLVHEWAKYRYGIFDETGFAGDALYPAYVMNEGGRPAPTVTHNGVLTGGWMTAEGGTPCDPSAEQDCRFVADPHSDVTCSLGQGLNLANTLRYCNASEYTTLPTKHAVLCHGRSALEVIQSHPDFRRVAAATDASVRDVRPEMNIVREPTTKYVLAIDTSSAMLPHWRWIHKAAHKFIRYDLPVNSNLAVLTFNQERAKLEHQLVQVTSDQTRARLADTVPVRYHLSRTGGPACVRCGLETVYEQVLRGGVAGAHIILISADNNNNNEEDTERLRRLVAAHNNARVSSIIIPTADSAKESSSSPVYDELATQTRGLSYQLTDTGHAMDLLFQVNTALAEVLRAESLPPAESPELVHTAEYYSGEEAVSRGRFRIDPSLGRDTLFGIYVQDEEDHLIR